MNLSFSLSKTMGSFNQKQLSESINGQKVVGQAKRNYAHNIIFAFLMRFILFIEAIFVLISIFWKGVMKKEILSKESNIGFDIDIILKS